jgi:hypothetical protein
MVYEVRRQFKEIPGIMEGTGKPEYDKCVEISTNASLREMMLPGILTIGFPLIITFLPMLFGMDKLMIAEMLGGYMAGVTVSGVLWAIFQNNAGGAWDNAKKSFEAGVMINGEMTHKGSAAHEAAITGDTVGDPFKDTSGPSMNILIKLTCLIGLVIAPILGEGTAIHSQQEAKVSADIAKGSIIKQAKFYAIVEEVVFNENLIVSLIVPNVECDRSVTGLICEEFQNIVNRENLSFRSTNNKLSAKEYYENTGIEGELTLGDKILPAQLRYNINEDIQSFNGELVFQLDDVQIILHLKGMM